MWIKVKVVAFVLLCDHNIRINVGRCLPQVWGLMWGFIREGKIPGRQKPCRANQAYKGMPVYPAGLMGRAKRMRAQAALLCGYA
jgi:hypothetical protein